MSNSNYYNDYRVMAKLKGNFWEEIDLERMRGKFYSEGSEDEILIEIPLKFEICETCGGKGSHVNPSIDCNGLTSDDFYEDPDFAENYMHGNYDVPCYNCGGMRVVPTIDEDRADESSVKAYFNRIEFEITCTTERAAELRMGY